MVAKLILVVLLIGLLVVISGRMNGVGDNGDKPTGPAR